MAGSGAELLLAELRAACGGRPDAVRTDAAALEEASIDKSFHDAAAPLAVVTPETVEEVAACVDACARHGVPVTPRGAGTGVEGGCVPYRGGVVLSTAALQTLRLHKDDMVCTVGAGVKKAALNDFLRPHGLLFGPDPSSNPAVGGMASTGGSGMSTLKYGTTRENVVSMLVVTPQGEVLRTRQVVRKSSTGYDLNNLYIGAEGTLGIICELVVKVWPLPSVRSGGTLEFSSVDQACRCVVQLVRSLPPALLKCEMLNAEGVRATNAVFNTSLAPTPTLFLELVGHAAADKAALAEQWAQIATLARANGARAASFAEDGDALDGLWDARRGCYIAAGMYRQRKGGDRVLLTDVCVPLTRLAECVSKTEAIFTRGGFPCVMCCHIADGNFHCCVPYQPEEKERCQELEHEVIELALSLGGTVSGEHGVGVGKVAHMCAEHGEVHIRCQQAIKAALDPLNLMNPGKVLPDAKPSPPRAKL
eukprot:jgi/Tetstr1/442188/TSEL_030338.t1